MKTRIKKAWEILLGYEDLEIQEKLHKAELEVAQKLHKADLKIKEASKTFNAAQALRDERFKYNYIGYLSGKVEEVNGFIESNYNSVLLSDIKKAIENGIKNKDYVLGLGHHKNIYFNIAQAMYIADQIEIKQKEVQGKINQNKRLGI